MQRVLSICVALVSIVGVANADEHADALKIVDQAIKVHGGEAALSKIVSMKFKLKSTSFVGDDKVGALSETAISGNDKMRVATFDENGKTESVEVINGQRGWAKAGQTEDLTEKQIEYWRESIVLNWTTLLVPLKSKEYRLKLADEITLNDRKLVGVTIDRENKPAIKVYFDKETHLFVKTQRKYKNEEDKEIDEESFYSEYKDLPQIMQPMKCVTMENGVKVSEATVTEVTFFEKPLDDKLFEKP